MKKFVGLFAAMAVAATAQAQDGHTVYGGVDLVELDLSEFSETVPNSENNIGMPVRDDADTNMLRIRLGYYLNEDFAIEIHGGVANDKLDAAQSRGEVDTYYGIFVVPRAQPFDYLHFQFPLGWSETDIILPDGTLVERDSESFGINVQFFPTKLSFVPDDGWYSGFSVGGGFMVYHEGNRGLVRGFNYGLTYQHSFDFGD